MPFPKSEADAKANLDYCEAELRKVIPAHMLDASSSELSGEYFMALVLIAGRMVGERVLHGPKDMDHTYLIKGGMALLAMSATNTINEGSRTDASDGLADFGQDRGVN